MGAASQISSRSLPALVSPHHTAGVRACGTRSSRTAALAYLSARNANKQLTIVRRVIVGGKRGRAAGRLEDPTIGIRKRADESVHGEAPKFLELSEMDWILELGARPAPHREAANPVRRGHHHVSRSYADIFELLAQTGIRRLEVACPARGRRSPRAGEPRRSSRCAVPCLPGEDSTPKSKRARQDPADRPGRRDHSVLNRWASRIKRRVVAVAGWTPTLGHAASCVLATMPGRRPRASRSTTCGTPPESLLARSGFPQTENPGHPRPR